MRICLLTCCEALNAEILGPASAFSVVLPAGGPMGAYVVVLLSSVFPIAGAASTGVLMGKGASVVVAGGLSSGAAIRAGTRADSAGVSMGMGASVVVAG